MSNDIRTPKAAYARPELTVFGSVRNLTGGSVGGAGDGMSAMQVMV
ncbi:hypothetical protein [Altererythrobacter lauratis]